MAERLDPTKLERQLELLYGARAPEVAARIVRLADGHAGKVPERRPWLDQSDAMLITYGDSIRSEGEAPLRTLKRFLDETVGDVVSAVHLLPFYPWTSDDGFSVVDYRAIDPDLGGWDEVTALGERFELMFDGVINHASSKSAWFEGFKAGDARYRDFFVTVDPATDLSAVTRPRTTPLRTPVETKGGPRHVWTTFSADQVDLNYANPEVLLEILDILLDYAAKGARFIRMDAIGFLWKQPGTTSMHLPETHRLIQVMRTVVEAVAPGTLLITETNVPHADNVAYFGDGSNEAHLVYQFPLPPLTLHAFQTGRASRLGEWAASLEPTAPRTTFLNFLASHDGIGVRPLEGILSATEIDEVAARVVAHGGRVSERTVAGGASRPYELNIAYPDAIAAPDDDDPTRAKKFLAAQTILLSTAGLPAIYVHSLLGSRSDHAGLAATGRNRSINREKLDRVTVERELATSGHLRTLVFAGHERLLGVRRRQPALHPDAGQRVLALDDRVLALLRGSDGDRLLALINVSDEAVAVRVPAGELPDAPAGVADLLGGRTVTTRGAALEVTLEPYGAAWLVPAR